jgi:hypothetical protein
MKLPSWVVWVRRIFGFLMTLAGIVGLASLGADLRSWERWLGANHTWLYALLYALVLLVGVSLLVVSFREHRAQAGHAAAPTGEVSSTPVAKPTERSSAGDAATDPEPRRYSSTENAKAVARLPSAPGSLRARLQEALNEGIRLQKGVNDLGMVRFAGPPATRDEDVTTWEHRVETILANDPIKIGLFKYEKPRSVLDDIGFTAGLTRAPLRRRLEQRIDALADIIRGLPRE